MIKLVLILFVLSSCDGEVRQFESLPLGLPCDPDNTPATIPGCRVCQTSSFYECCAEIPERIACYCGDLYADGEYVWLVGGCRNKENPGK